MAGAFAYYPAHLSLTRQGDSCIHQALQQSIHSESASLPACCTGLQVTLHYLHISAGTGTGTAGASLLLSTDAYRASQGSLHLQH